MPDYIDRDALLAQLNLQAKNDYNANVNKIVMSMPTCDVAPVVRCKDCKYFIDATVNTNGFTICSVSDMEITPTDFCSYAE